MTREMRGCLLLAAVAFAITGCSAPQPQVRYITTAQPQSRTVQCRDLTTGAISGHMGIAPECDPGQEQIWSSQTSAGSSTPVFAVIAPPGISFARYCYDTDTMIARGRDDQCRRNDIDLTAIEYRAIARK